LQAYCLPAEVESGRLFGVTQRVFFLGVFLFTVHRNFLEQLLKKSFLEVEPFWGPASRKLTGEISSYFLS
jgi:hypothetical protein